MDYRPAAKSSISARCAKFLLVVLLLTVALTIFIVYRTRPDTSPRKKFTGEHVHLRIHAWEGYVQKYAAKFKAYARDTLGLDITIELTRPTGLASFISAIEQQDIHLISPANDLLVPLLERKLIRPVDRARVPKLKEVNPIILETRFFELQGQTMAVPFTFGPYAIAYNKDKMKRPTSYAVLWDPRFKKRVTVAADYGTPNIYMTALKLGFPAEDLFDLDDGQLAAIEAELNTLCAEQVAELWKTNLNPARTDRFDVGMDWGIGVTLANRKYGKNWGLTVPKEGGTGWVDNWAITKNVTGEALTAAVHAYMNFMLSSKIQAQVAQVTSYGPVNPYAGRYMNTQERHQHYLYDPNYLKKLILWRPLDSAVLEKYEALWRRVCAGTH